MRTKVNWQVLFLNSTRAGFSLDGWARTGPWAVQVVGSLSGGDHTGAHTPTQIHTYRETHTGTRTFGKPPAEWVEGLREGWVVSGRERTELTQPRGVGSRKEEGAEAGSSRRNGGRERGREGVAVECAEVAIGKPHRST